MGLSGELPGGLGAALLEVGRSSVGLTGSVVLCELLVQSHIKSLAGILRAWLLGKALQGQEGCFADNKVTVGQKYEF